MLLESISGVEGGIGISHCSPLQNLIVSIKSRCVGVMQFTDMELSDATCNIDDKLN